MARMPGHTYALRASLFPLLIALASFAQQPKVLAPHKPIAPKVPKSLEHHEPGVPRSMVGGFWMIDANRKASIYLKNDLETAPLTVTPSLYLSNGARYKLDPVTLEESGTAVISINEALAKHGISSWATLSGYVEVEYTWAWDPICVSVTSIDPVHSVIFTTGVQPSVVADLSKRMTKPQVEGMYAVDGMWWKPEAGVTGFVALSNTAAEAVSARVQASDSAGRVLGDYAVRVSPHGTKIVALRALEKVPVGSAGGLRVLHTGTVEGLLINGQLEDQSSGYSANLPFHYSFTSTPQPTGPEAYAELGLMTGAADPMMQFPAGTVFTPFSVARNVSDQPISVTPSVYWMQGGTARSARLKPFTLLPAEAQNLDVPRLLADAGLQDFNGSVNLILEAEGKPRALLLASGSVDQKNTYVFQVLPRGVQESNAKTISYWSTGNGDDTMVTVWNPADESQDYRFALFFAGGHYRFPIHLEPRSTRVFNISEIIQNQIPDEDGNIIPATVHEGSAKISGSHADNEEILVALDAGTYNVRKATCSYYCISCDGEVLAFAIITPFSMAKGGTRQLTFSAQDNHGNQYSTSGTWSSSKTSVATVGSNSGLVTAVSPGTSTFYASTTGDIFNFSYCAYDPFCPDVSSFQGSGGGNVPPTITGLSPPSVVVGTSGVWRISGSGFAAFPGITPTVYVNIPGVTTSGATVVSDSLISVGYKVSSSTGVGGGSLQVSFATTDGGQASSNLWPFTVTAPTVTVTLSIQSSGTAANDNSARGAYNTEVGRYGLGAFVGTGQFCTIGYQVSGTVSPSTYTGTINLVRTKGGRSWKGSTGQTLDQTFATGTPDTSPAQFEDTNPQSGGSQGVVYDLDAPGSSPAVSQVGRIRYNFVENAQLPDGTYVANEVAFYVRLSCNWGSAGNSFRTEFSGDNVFGMGTTKTSYNLQ